ncbi:DegV family protein [Mycoplasmatota bacterium]|nr:DegV family protein [Mycoplasmatota bacterium]
MQKIKILTDSTADLSQDLLKKRDIDVIALHVEFDHESFDDGITITTEELYQKVEEKGKLPKTAAVSPGEFMIRFEKYLKEDYDIVYISIGSKISSTYQSAMIARDALDANRIHLIDSKNLSSGIALLVLKACDLRDKGLSASQIKEELEKIVPLVRSQFAIKTLDYLHKGGRASGTAKLIGTIIQLKPIIQVRQGLLDVYKKPVGKMSRALDVMLDDFFEEVHKDNIDLDYVMITHSLAHKSSKYMHHKVHQVVKPKQLIESYAGCVISSHCGQGTIGILYIVKNA